MNRSYRQSAEARQRSWISELGWIERLRRSGAFEEFITEQLIEDLLGHFEPEIFVLVFENVFDVHICLVALTLQDRLYRLTEYSNEILARMMQNLMDLNN